ncbi:hypothetical protein RE628_05500 [Paenibacillus sp. D2_2]|uniref:hypothetical protein n=1 Tax=Paenibacillus sp. D2_2 TaxID=3073092 RepID=UPI002815AAAF|nr:hypothetical protein [Paenibacillus sp. D2_2]WMT41902.1 hypothetical protein RE628_05500 [Paenibacillus sp. D2_2]
MTNSGIQHFLEGDQAGIRHGSRNVQLGERECPKWPEGSKLTASNITNSSVVLTWNGAVSSTTKYKIYQDNQLISIVGSNVKSYTVNWDLVLLTILKSKQEMPRGLELDRTIRICTNNT